MVKRTETEILRDFRQLPDAPEGEWVTEFPVGVTFEPGGNRKVDGLCITSRPPAEPSHKPSVDTIRQRQSAGWLDGERVVLVEIKGREDSWKGLGQILVYEKLFEMDWDVTIEALIVVSPENKTGDDSKELLQHYFGNVDLYWHDDDGIHH